MAKRKGKPVHLSNGRWLGDTDADVGTLCGHERPRDTAFVQMVDTYMGVPKVIGFGDDGPAILGWENLPEIAGDEYCGHCKKQYEMSRQSRALLVGRIEPETVICPECGVFPWQCGHIGDEKLPAR